MGANSPILEVEDEWPPYNDEPPTLCRDCDHVHPDTRTKAPYQWRCMKFKAAPFGGFVDPDWRPDPPYHRCEKINRGACESWAPMRTASKGD